MINPIIFAEIAFDFDSIEAVNEVSPASDYECAAIPRDTAFLAARCHAKYRAAGGMRTMILPDFLIGAHALIERMTLLTRDVQRYRSYFPGLRLICPAAGETGG